MQRLFDIIFSALVLLILSPLLAPIAALLLLTGEGEVFYLQDRIGRNGKRFKLYKFATMLKNSPALGTGTITVKNDPRVLPVGKFLRKTKINELPQLLNILFGDMSVIGPRPLTEQTFSAYAMHTQSRIVTVRPGLSGIGSIVFRSEESILSQSERALEFYNSVIAPYKGELESWYVENYTLSTYFKAIIITVVAVLWPSSKAVWTVFKGLPTPPDALRFSLNYPIQN